MTRGRPRSLATSEPSAEAIDDVVEHGLSARTRRLIEASESDETLATYAWGVSIFLEFCANYGGRDEHGVRRRGLTPFPCTPETLAEYVGHLAHLGMAPASIRTALAAVRRKHRVDGHPAPDSVQANAAVAGYQDLLLADGWRPGGAAPARSSVIGRLIDVCDLDTPKGLRDRVMVLLGRAVLMRRRALVNLNVTDVEDLENEGLRVKIWRDKGKKHRTATVPHWGRPRNGRCKDPMCAACATLTWVGWLAERGVRGGPMLRPVDRHGNVAGVSALAGGYDARMDPSGMHFAFTSLVTAAGLAGRNITLHALRVGGAVELYEEGAEELSIRRLGGWADGSAAFYGYLRDVDERLANPLNALVAGRRRKTANRKGGNKK